MMDPFSTTKLMEGMAPADDAPSESEPYDFHKDYWLSSPYYSTEFGEDVIERFNQHITDWNSSAIGNAIWRAYRAYYSLSGSSGDEPMVSLYTTGESSELLNMDVAQYRQYVRRQCAIVTQQRPAWDPQARTADAEAARQVPMARNLLDYDMQFSPLQDRLVDQHECAKVCASAFLVSGWNPNIGLDQRGWFTTHVLAPWEMAHERVRDYDTDCTWWVYRAYESRWEWVARYAKTDPRKAREIYECDASDELFSTSFMEYESRHGVTASKDRIPVLYVMAKPTLACPEGRYSIVAGGGLVLLDGAHPYGNDVPVSRLCSATFIGTSVPYADSWGLLAPAEAYNGMMSALVTRVDLGAVPNIVTPTGSEFTSNDLGGANTIEVPPGAQVPASVLELLSIPEALPGAMSLIKEDMGDISGINAAVRGEKDAASSGAHAALMQSLAVQFNSNDERAWALNMERVGTQRIRIFQRMASDELTITVCGTDHAWTGKKFRGEHLKDILKVAVKVANPMSKTTAGRLEMATQMLTNGGATPAEYLRVAETGQLEDTFAGPNKHLNLVTSENESLMRGEQVHALYTDQHDLHIREHRELLTGDVRTDPNKLQLVEGHIQEHQELYEQMSREAPDRCFSMGLKPLPTAYAVGQQGRAAMSGAMGMPPAAEAPPDGPDPQEQPNTVPSKGGKPPGPAPAPKGREPSSAAPSEPKPAKAPNGESVV